MKTKTPKAPMIATKRDAITVVQDANEKEGRGRRKKLEREGRCKEKEVGKTKELAETKKWGKKKGESEGREGRIIKK